MFAPRVVCAFMALPVLAAHAQPAPEAGEPTRAEIREPVRENDTQQRRALLRASLKSQPDVALARASTGPAARQMSDRERADLRQQLRQQ